MSKLAKSFKNLGYNILCLDNVCYSDSPTQGATYLEACSSEGCETCDTCSCGGSEGFKQYR